MTNNDQPKKNLSRRQALKLLTAVTGATALSQLPSKWSKPLLQVGLLPAHAQTSPTATAVATATSTPSPTDTPAPTNTPAPTSTPAPIDDFLDVDLSWDAEVGQMNLDLEVYDPGDNMWATPANPTTYTLQHGGDSPLASSGAELVDSTIGVVVGQYQVWLRVIATDASQGFLMFADIDIATSSDSGTGFIDFETQPADNELIHVADVDYLSGVITWFISTFP